MLTEILHFQVQGLKQTLAHQRQELNDCRAEITALKMHIEGSRSTRNVLPSDVDITQSQSLERYEEEIKSLQYEIERLKAKSTSASDSVGATYPDTVHTEEKVVEIDEDKTITSSTNVVAIVETENPQSLTTEIVDNNTIKQPGESSGPALTISSNEDMAARISESVPEQSGGLPSEDSGLHLKPAVSVGVAASDKVVICFSYRGIISIFV